MSTLPIDPYKGISKQVLVEGLRDVHFQLSASTEKAIAEKLTRKEILELRQAVTFLASQRAEELITLKVLLRDAACYTLPIHLHDRIREALR